jgi:glycosyltransferase involved in cell wall biosynthesis
MGESRLRVLHIMEATIGGARRHITDVASGLAGRGVDLHLVVSAERQSDFRHDFEALTAAGAVVHELAMQRSVRPWTDTRQVLKLLGLVRRLRPDIVHTHSSKAGVLGRVAATLAGHKRRVHTPHAMAFLFEDMFSARKRRVYYALEKLLSRSCERVIAVSESEARTFRASGVVAPDKVRVVQNGVDPEAFLAAEPLCVASLGLDPARPTWAVVGLLNVAKGQDLALEALAAPSCEGLQLIFAGHGALEAELKAQARRLGLEQRVAFLGFRRDVARLLASAAGLCLPSRWEGMPYIVLEAMAAGLPVVALPVDGARDLVIEGRTGWVAPEISSEALARTLARACACSDEELRALGAAGRVRVLEHFTLEHMLDSLQAVYAELS